MQLTRLALAGAAFAALAAVPGPLAAQDAPEISVPGGVVRGAMEPDSLVFRGIPYAAAPVGDLRWTPPQPRPAWDGVLDTTKNAPACPQYSEGWNQAQADDWDEDCLTIDIRTPSLDGKRPVMVWIHGGSNRAGSSGGPADSDLTRQGVVAVAIQYRLGLLGFLSHPELSAQQGGTSGNYALMDQVAALRWVRDNIHLFGGDPDQVTIYGESAGSQDVSLMLAVPSAQGLFDAAIMQSGTPGFGREFRSLEDAERLGATLGPVAGLRSMTAQQLVDATKAYEASTGIPLSPFLNTVVDGRVLPAAPDVLLKAREPVPVIIGTDRLEFTGPDDAEGQALSAQALYGNRAAGALAIYAAEQANPRRGDIGDRIISDVVFHCPADRMADLLADAGWPVWRYEFDIGATGGLTGHAQEIAWVFERKPVGSNAYMQDYWAALAVSGDPNGVAGVATKRPEWARWRTDAPRQLEITAQDTSMQPGRPRAEVCALVDAL